MNKGICVFIGLLTLSTSIFPMDWGDKNPNSPVDMNDPRVWELLTHSFPSDTDTDLENNQESADFINAILSDDSNNVQHINEQSENFLSCSLAGNNAGAANQEVDNHMNEEEQELSHQTIQSNEHVNKQSVGTAEFSIQCPVCLELFQGNQHSSNFFREFYGHVVYEIALHSPALKENVDEIVKQLKPHCFKCGSSIATELTINAWEIYRHLGCKHLAEIFDEYAQSVVIPGLPSTVEEFYDYCSQQCPNEKQRKTWKYAIPCQLAGCKKILHSNEFPSEARNKYLHHIVRHVASATQLDDKIRSFLNNRNFHRCLFDNCGITVNGHPSDIIDHLTRYHLQDLLEQYPIITLDQIDGYLHGCGIIRNTLNKRKLALTAGDSLDNGNKEKKIIPCQLCGKEIKSTAKKASGVKRHYLTHLVGEIVNSNNKLDKFQCYVCDKKIVEKGERQHGRIFQHLLSDHLATIFDQSEQLCGTKITREAVDNYLKDYGIVVEARKKPKRNLNENVTKELNDTIHETLSNQSYTNFIKKMDQIIDEPTDVTTLSIEDMAAYLGVPKE